MVSSSVISRNIVGFWFTPASTQTPRLHIYSAYESIIYFDENRTSKDSMKELFASNIKIYVQNGDAELNTNYILQICILDSPASYVIKH